MCALHLAKANLQQRLASTAQHSRPNKYSLNCIVLCEWGCGESVPGIGIVPIPEPVPWKVMHMPQATELPN